MKFKLKKLVALLVTSFIGVTSICPAFAAETEIVSSVLVETEDCNKAKDEFMADINTIANLISVNLGRDNIDIANVTIGEPFLVGNSDIYIFPVIIDGDIERLIQMTKSNSGNNLFAISEFFADNFNNLSNDTYKIVADEDFNVFAINDEKKLLIDKNSDDKESITEPVMALSDEDLEVVDVKDTFVDLSAVPLSYATGSGNWNYNFPIVGQGNKSSSCWAACMSSILKGNEENVSFDNVLTTTQNTGTSNYSDVKNYFSRYYKYSSQIFNQYQLTLSDIASEIDSGGALYQDLVSDVKSSHAVVVYGYQYENGSSSKNGIVSIMDPGGNSGKGKRVDCNYTYKDREFEYNYRTSAAGLYKFKK